MLVGSPVLIPLDQNRIALRNQEACYVVSIKILVECPALSRVGVANARFAGCTPQRGGRLGSRYGPRREERVEMAEGTDPAAQFAQIGEPTAGRIAFVPPVRVCFRSICSKTRPGVAAHDGGCLCFRRRGNECGRAYHDRKHHGLAYGDSSQHGFEYTHTASPWNGPNRYGQDPLRTSSIRERGAAPCHLMP